LDAAKSQYAVAAQELDSTRRDKASLSHALDLRAQQLSSEGGGDVPSRLLYALAKGREEAVSLAVQLAEKARDLRQAEESNKSLRGQFEALETLRQEATADAAAAHASACDADARGELTRVDAEAAVNAAHEAAAHARALAEDVAANAEAVGEELRREQERSAQLGRALDESEATLAADLNELRREMDAAVDATTAEAAAGSAAAVREAEAAMRRVAELQSELAAVRRMAAAAEETTATTAAGTERRLEESAADATRCREHAATLEARLGSLGFRIRGSG
jgi:chromosome segregation ATPase